MKVNEQWLREWVNPSVDSKALAEQLTMAGLEVDSIEPAAPAFTGVVVGLVKECVQHPDADRLRCCKVDVGAAELLDIVCGAPNARAGLKVAVATVGAVLPGDFKIKSTKLRGQPSMGMLCSSKELGMGDDHNGIIELSSDAPIGKDIREYLNLDDHIIEIELTPNRGDCLSVRGIARELGVVNQLPVKEVSIVTTTPTIKDTLTVTLNNAERCPHYVGRVIRDISMAAKIPAWMSERLQRAGLRSINPVVDVCNYVMLELGQPMHGFDLDTIKNGIVVRTANKNEKIKLLDETVVDLDEKTLVIADHEKPLAIAGIMGGLDSSVTEKSQHIFLESAFFTSVDLRLDARRHQLQTDSSYRFERGVDYQLQAAAIERATELLLAITGGKAGPIVNSMSEKHMPSSVKVTLQRNQIKRYLGIEIEDKRIVAIFSALGMQVDSTNEGWSVTIPSYRFDFEGEADLIEEIARIEGYNTLPTHQVRSELQMPEQSEKHISTARIADALADRGYAEVITYSFVDPEVQKVLDPAIEALLLSNPIASDLAAMRTSMWPGLLQAALHNLHRQISRVRLFETGLVYRQTPAGCCEQTPRLGLLVSGSVSPEQWGDKARSADFYDLKGDIEALMGLTGQAHEYSWKPGTHPALHPGQSADILKKGHIVGHLGVIHPKIVQHFSLKRVILLCEIELAALGAARIPEYEAISKFPGMRRDLALVLNQEVSAETIVQQIHQSAGQLLKDVQVFDVYQGDNIEPGKKSVALGLFFQDPSRTLVDEEVNQCIQNVIADLGKHLKATLRA